MKYASVAIMPLHDLKNLRTILIFVFLILLDLYSKYLVFNNIDLYQFIKITPFFDITHIHNFGVSFGLFSGTISPLYLIIIGLLVVSFIIFLLVNAQDKLEQWGLFIIICGALANIIDRFINGYVIDFIYLHINQYYWPAFNVADAAISFGVFLLFLDIYQGWREQKKH
jgi:signal peptidase II